MLWQVILLITQQILLVGISTENWNNYNNNTAHPLVNKAVQNSYSPGSTFKMVTAIAGLESGVIDLNTKINDTGVYMKYANTGYRPKCWYYSDYEEDTAGLMFLVLLKNLVTISSMKQRTEWV